VRVHKRNTARRINKNGNLWSNSALSTLNNRGVNIMADFKRDDMDPNQTKSGKGGMTIGLVVLAAVVIVGLLFASGFWSADVTKSGALPEVSIKGGALPNVDLDSKEVVVGTTKTEVEVPTVETKTTTIDVPTIGVKDNGEK